MIKFFKNFPEITAIMSEKKDGSMKVVKEYDGNYFNIENRKRFLKNNNIGYNSVVFADIVHGNNVEIIRNINEVIPPSDALITKNKNIFLAIGVADCIPVFLYEEVVGIIGIIHVGWRGVVKEVVKKTIDRIVFLGGEKGNIRISIGPGINGCHFEIKDNILEEFKNYKDFVINKNNKIFVDLKAILMKQLLDCGIVVGNIENDNRCTYCNDNFFSFRRDKSKIVETMMATIGLK